MPQQIKFDKYPEKTVQGYKAVQGWEDVRECLDKAAKENGVLTAEFYPGVNRGELVLGVTHLVLLSKLYFRKVRELSCAQKKMKNIKN